MRPVRRVLDTGRASAERLADRVAWWPRRSRTDPSALEREIGAVARGTPTTVHEVIAKLDAIYELAVRSPRGPDDGIAAFTALYRTITENVLRWLQEGRFDSSEYLTVLDLEFAERYFEALRRYAFDRSATPACWRALFDNRADSRISRLHSAVAGVNAHINFDLALAVVSTCMRLGVEFGADSQRRDYLAVNQIFTANTRQLRSEFEMRADPVAVDAVQQLFDDFAVVASREVAWKDAERLWPHRHDRTRMAQETWLLDHRAAVLGKGILGSQVL